MDARPTDDVVADFSRATMRSCGIAGIALVISSATLADVPTRYVSTDHLDNIGVGSGVVIGPGAGAYSCASI
jgi:hypothetical protein